MTIVVDDLSNSELLREPAKSILWSRKAVALTGAGISVESGIPDFRSPGGLWEIFDPGEYAHIETFIRNPEKSWRLFREVGRTLMGKVPNPAHTALATLEQKGILHSVITQNIDGLHQQAGSKEVIEVHGDHARLECIRCNTTIPVTDQHILEEEVPSCRHCGFQLKPAVVLFGEAIKGVEMIRETLNDCDVLIVVGTSAQVQPVAALPWTVKSSGGMVIEFNLESTALTGMCSDYLLKGTASSSLGRLVEVMNELQSS